MSTVEMSLPAGDLSAAMAEMRIWLDERRFEPSSFSCCDIGAGVVIRVDFCVATEAAAFAGRFCGRIGGSEAGSGDNPAGEPSLRQSTACDIPGEHHSRERVLHEPGAQEHSSTK